MVVSNGVKDQLRIAQMFVTLNKCLTTNTKEAARYMYPSFALKSDEAQDLAYRMGGEKA
jgi:hypothetical protein